MSAPTESELLQAASQSIIQTPSSSHQWTCDPCNFSCSAQHEYFAHLNTPNHKIKILRMAMPTEKEIEKEVTHEQQVKVMAELQKEMNTRCAICNCDCTTPDMLKNHLKGKKHKFTVMKLQRRGFASTAIQDMATSGTSLPPMVKAPPKLPLTNIVKKKAPDTSIGPKGYKPPPIITPKLGPYDVRCQVCDVVCTGKKAYILHLNGVKHKKLLKKMHYDEKNSRNLNGQYAEHRVSALSFELGTEDYGYTSRNDLPSEGGPSQDYCVGQAFPTTKLNQ